MKKILFFLFLSIHSLAFAFQWPIAGGFLTASFGENNHGSFLKGIRMSGHGSVVSPFLEGELIYSTSESDALVPVLGNTKVLHHDNGFRSIYGNLEKSYSQDNDFVLQENEQLGIVGNSGRIYEKSLFLMIFDTEQNQFLNPQIVLPPSGDTVAPQINGIYLSINGEELKLSDLNIVQTGRAEVYGEIDDTAGSSTAAIRTVPYSISMFYLGNEISQIKFDTLRKGSQELILEGGHSLLFDNLYRDDRIFLGEISLNRGVAFLEVSTSDRSGNTSTKTFQLTIE